MPKTAPKVRITLDGRLALTVEQAAARYGLAPSSMSAAISRGAIEPDGELDGKKKLYLAERLDAIMRARPGKGANLRRAVPRPGRSRREVRQRGHGDGSLPVGDADVPGGRGQAGVP